MEAVAVGEEDRLEWCPLIQGRGLKDEAADGRHGEKVSRRKGDRRRENRLTGQQKDEMRSSMPVALRFGSPDVVSHERRQ